MHTINWITNYSKNTLLRSRCFILTLFQVLKVGYVIKYCVWWWCFILTLNRASALSGSKYEQNYLLLSESRCNRRKNRFRVKTKRGLQLCQDRNMNKITCCYLNLVAIEKRIGLESKQTRPACFDFQFCEGL